MKLCMGCMEMYDNEVTMCPHCGFEENTPPEEAFHLKPGTKLGLRYVIGRVLGFGVTYIGYDELTEKKVTIKEYLPSEFATRIVEYIVWTAFRGCDSLQAIYVKEHSIPTNFLNTYGYGDIIVYTNQ